MKLVKTFNSDGTRGGYFDPKTQCVYDVMSLGATPPQPKMFRVYVSKGDDLYQFLSPLYGTREEAMTELDRLAALISGEAAPVGESWVKGAPPKDGQWYVTESAGALLLTRYCERNDIHLDRHRSTFPAYTLTHHLPTPIHLPKEIGE